MNVSTIGKNLKSFNRLGCRIMMDIKDMVPKETFDGIPVPRKAVTMDYLAVENNFGKGVKYLVKYKNKKGKVLKTIKKDFIDGCFHKLNVTEYKYPNKKTVQTLSEKFNGSYGLYEKTKKTISIDKKKINGKSVVSALKSKFNIFYTSNGVRHENQIIESFDKKSPRKFLQTMAIRNLDGSLSDTYIMGNIEEIAELEKDPYIFSRLYPKEEFMQTCTHYAAKKQKVDVRKVSVVNKKLEYNTKGQSDGKSKTIYIDLEKSDIQQEIVGTLNHEYRHQYQSLFANDVQLIVLHPAFALEEKIYAIRCKLSENIYGACQKLGLYRMNFLERDANKKTREAVREYEKFSRDLMSNFDATSDQYPVFGYSSEVGILECFKLMPKAIVKIVKNPKVLKKFSEKNS